MLPALNSQVELLSIDGKQVMQLNPSSRLLQIDVSELTSGSYILKVLSENNNATRLIVVE